MKNGVVGRTTDDFFRYQGWPTVARDEKGVLYVYYQKYPGDTYNSILSTRWELPKEG